MNVRISQLPTAPDAISGSELVPIVQNGQTVQTTVSAITNSPSLTQTFLTTTQESTLPNSRYIGGGLGIGTSDAGAQGLYSVFLNGTSASLENASTGIIVKSGVNTVVNRLIAAGTTGLSVSNGNGISGNPTLSLTGLALSAATLTGNGMVSLVGGSYFQNVTLTGTTNQISIANPNGGSNPTFSIADNPTIPGTAGMVVPSGTTGQRASIPTNGQMRYNTTSSRFEFYEGGSWANIGTGDGTVTEVLNVVNQTSVINGTTTPAIGIASNAILPGLSAVTLPKGATSDRTGSPASGMIRYNTQSNVFEGYLDTGWQSFAVSGGVTSFSGGTTGFTPNTATGGAIVLGGTLNAANGGTGATTLTGYVYGNGTGAMTASTTIPNAGLANSSITIGSTSVSLGGTITTFAGTSISGSTNTLTNIGNGSLTNSSITIGSTSVSLGGTITTFAGVSISGSTNTLSNIGNSSLTNSAITINGSSVSLGGSITVTATATNALTIGTGLSGTSYNGSSPVTIAIDSTVVTLTGSQVLTNKSISGSTNTLTNIGNSSLTNSSLTIGTTNISLGGTSLTLGGLTSVTVTQDPTAALQLATKQYVDSVAQGLDAKASCVYGTTNNITLSGLGTQAGGDWASSLTAGDRILVKNQSSSQFNGIYVAAASTWARSADMDTWAEVPSSFVFIESGSTLADTGWVTTANAGGTIDVTAMPWVQFSGAGTYTAGTGLTLTGTQFSLTSPVTTSLGGTGSTSALTQYGVVYGSTTSAMATTAAGTSTQVLHGNASGAPTFGAVSLTTDVSGVLPIANGGTNSTASPTAGGVGYGTGTANAYTGAGTSGQSLISAGAGAPAFGALAIGVANTNVSGALTVTNGGTGVATLTGLAYGNGTSAFTAASAAQVVAVIGSTAVTNAANVAVATGAATTNYLSFVTATTGNLPVLTNSGLTYNSSTNAITGGISGGTF
jgi:hypothetical protein